MAAPGARLAGRYELVAPIGAGGMAVVWRAIDLRLLRAVAVKILREPLGDDPELVRRFQDEARNAASLSHPNVATVFDTGVDHGELFIVMELADGPTVADLLRRRGSLPAPLAVEVAAAAARGLAAAHRRGLIHRDVKPANLLVARDGTVRLADFGIARALTASRETLPGTVLGSIPYLSPEQARGEESTATGDVFSLGVVLFEMLTGRLPWTADSPSALAAARLTEPPLPPSAVRQDLPDGLDRIVMRALALDPRVRYPSARAFAETLETWLRRAASVAALPAPDLADTVAALPAGDVGAVEARLVASAAARLNPPPGVAAPPLLRAEPRSGVRGESPSGLHAEPPSAPMTRVSSAGPAGRPGAVAPGTRRRRRAGWLVVAAALVSGILLLQVGLASLVGEAPGGGVLEATGSPDRSPFASPVASTAPAAAGAPSPASSATPEPVATPTPRPKPKPTPKPKPKATPTPRPTSGQPAPPDRRTGPARSVAAFYDAVEAHDWDRATALWSPSMQERYPPDEWLVGRFRRTTRIDVTDLRTVAIDRAAGTATVAVTIVEYRSVDPRRRTLAGTWDLVRIDGSWLLDDPDF